MSEVIAPPGGRVLTLPSGFHIALKPTRAIRRRDRAKMYAGFDLEAGLGMDDALSIADNLLKQVITGWDVRDYDDATGEPVGDVLPIPSETSEDVLGYLSLEDAMELDKVAQEIQSRITPNFDPSPDQASPTRPSAG